MGFWEQLPFCKPRALSARVHITGFSLTNVLVHRCFFLIVVLLLCKRRYSAVGFIFTRTRICQESQNWNLPKIYNVPKRGESHYFLQRDTDSATCQDLLTGVLTIRNDQTLRLEANGIAPVGQESRLATLHDPTQQGIRITLKKSAVSFLYDLQYEIDAFSEFREDMYEYSYSEVGQNPGHFCYVRDVEKCGSTAPEGISRTPDGSPVPWAYGRCCWCASAPLYESASGSPLRRRSNLKCSSFDALLSRTVWVTKSCPRIRGPWYTGLRVGQWKWQYEIDMTLEWYSPPSIDHPAKDGLFSSEAEAVQRECLENNQTSPRKALKQQETANLSEPTLKPYVTFSTNADKAHMPTQIDRILDVTVGSDTIVKRGVQNQTVQGLTPYQYCLQQRGRQAGFKVSHHHLNISVPEIFQENPGVKIRITGSLPQTDANPPALNNYWLFIPTHPDEDPIVKSSRVVEGCGIDSEVGGAKRRHLQMTYLENLMRPKDNDEDSYDWAHLNWTSVTSSKRKNALTPKKRLPSLKHPCLTHALLLPAEMVDATGLRCNAVGTSIETWGNGLNGDFCSSPMGSCMGNQLGALRQEDLERISRGEPPQYHLTDKSLPGGIGSLPRLTASRVSSETKPKPLNIKNKEQPVYFSWRYLKEHITSLEVEINATEIVWIRSPSPGVIVSATAEPACNALSKSGCAIHVVCENTGNKSGRYVVSIPYCVDTANVKEPTIDIASVAPLGKTIPSNHVGIFLFRFHSKRLDTGIAERNYLCKIILSDDEGRRLDQILFDVKFLKIERLFQGQQMLARPATVNITRKDINESEGSSTLKTLLRGLKLPITTAAESLFASQECPCSVINILCVLANFLGCISRVRGMVISSVGVMGFAATAYMCAPTFTFCLKCFGGHMVALRQRQQRYLASTPNTTPHPQSNEFKTAITPAQVETSQCGESAHISVMKEGGLRDDKTEDQSGEAQESTVVSPR